MAGDMISMHITDWNIEEMCGYKPKTTFFTDFSIADGFGAKAVQDTYERAFNEWKENVEYVTELVMVLNWKIWEHYGHNEELATLYNDLWTKAGAWCEENLKGDDLIYYYETTD